MSILELRNVEKIYGEKDNQVKALRNINLKVEEGEFVAIVGTSGSGKSTCLNLIGGLDNPTSGQIFIKNKEIGSLSRKELTIFRRRNIGFVFQNYSLMPVLNVYETWHCRLHLTVENILTANISKNCCGNWAFGRNARNIQTNYPAVSSKELQSPELWQINRVSCFAMNRQVIWTQPQPLRLWGY